jgi:hypothetical protein
MGNAALSGAGRARMPKIRAIAVSPREALPFSLRNLPPPTISVAIAQGLGIWP